jgi:hypothetical protein
MAERMEEEDRDLMKAIGLLKAFSTGMAKSLRHRSAVTLCPDLLVIA